MSLPKQKWAPACPDCGSIDLEWKTWAFFKVVPSNHQTYVELDLDKPVSVDYEADGDIYCNSCADYKGRPKGWDTWKRLDPKTGNPVEEVQGELHL